MRNLDPEEGGGFTLGASLYLVATSSSFLLLSVRRLREMSECLIRVIVENSSVSSIHEHVQPTVRQE